MATTTEQIIHAAASSAPLLSPSDFLLGQQQGEHFSISEELIHTQGSPAKPVKRRRGRPPLAKPSAKTSSKLLGAKSQKRNLINGSPKKASNQLLAIQSTGSQAGTSNPIPTKKKTPGQENGLSSKQGSSNSAMACNPKISIIPSTKKNRVDFRNLPTPLP